MIGKLRGIVETIGEDHLIVDVGGVGYLVFASTRMLATTPSPGEEITLWIETYVREDVIRLYGFASEQERDWFRLLQSVQGVGARLALAIQGTLSSADLTSAIALQDKSMVARAPGVGPKVAQRIVSELKDKGPTLAMQAGGGAILESQLGANSAPPAVADAVSALTNLGYTAQQAAGAISKAVSRAGQDADSATLIRMGLKELAG